jgi:hypothetical protein
LLHLGAALLAAVAAATCNDWDAGSAHDCSDEGQRAFYDRRIAPLFEEDRPKSCNQCHLSGVDIDLWFKDTPCQTMACMIQEGLVDLDDPESSLILSWIDRAAPDSTGITDAVIAEERAGFLEWIESTAECGACEWQGDACEHETPYQVAGGDCAVSEYDDATFGFDDPGDCSDKTLEQVFLNTFFPVRMRCYPCHFESFANDVPAAPKWIAIGPCEIAALKTMRNVIDSGFIDYDDPAKSLWVLKPLAESAGGVEHGGAAKFDETDDQGAQDMIYFATRWAECRTP